MPSFKILKVNYFCCALTSFLRSAIIESLFFLLSSSTPNSRPSSSSFAFVNCLSLAGVGSFLTSSLTPFSTFSKATLKSPKSTFPSSMASKPLSLLIPKSARVTGLLQLNNFQVNSLNDI